MCEERGAGNRRDGAIVVPTDVERRVEDRLQNRNERPRVLKRCGGVLIQNKYTHLEEMYHYANTHTHQMGQYAEHVSSSSTRLSGRCMVATSSHKNTDTQLQGCTMLVTQPNFSFTAHKHTHTHSSRCRGAHQSSSIFAFFFLLFSSIHH